MPANKDHHYVSQFYMRNFGTGNSIELFNLARRRHIATARIPGQCQRAYFYGRCGVTETKLQRIEGDASNAIRSIIETDTLPAPNSDAHRALTTFISRLQISRTPDAVAVMRRWRARERQMERQINFADSPRRPAGVPGQRWRIVADDI